MFILRTFVKLRAWRSTAVWVGWGRLKNKKSPVKQKDLRKVSHDWDGIVKDGFLLWCLLYFQMTRIPFILGKN